MEKPSKDTIIRYLKGKSRSDEQLLVELYLSMDEDPDYLDSCIREVWENLPHAGQSKLGDHELTNFIEKFNQRKTKELNLADAPPHDSKILKISHWIKVAAAFLVFFGVYGVYQLLNKNTADTTLVENSAPFHPGSNKAVLTLADGSKVALSDAKNGTIANIDGFEIEKTRNGEIIYRVNDSKISDALTYNKVETPRGGQYQVVLPDGSRAYLNAESTLTYPTKFNNQDRRVMMTGEVYFEIEKVRNNQDHHMPFIVETEKQEIQVLGTHFNVNAYQNEPFIKTTLIEGSIQITNKNSGESMILKPGQESRLGTKMELFTVNTEEALAWTVGDFYFHEEELSSIVRKLSRWYNVDISYSAALGEIKLTGIFSRSVPLETIIESVEHIKSIKMKYNEKERRIVLKE